MSNKSKIMDALKLLIPTYSFLGDPRVADILPTLSKNKRHNMIAWNTLGSIASMGTIAAAIKALSAETHNEQWDRAQKSALASKLNSINPIATPDTNVTDEERKQRGDRRIAELDGTLTKNATELSEMVADTLGSMVPMGAGIGAAYFGSKAVDNIYTKKREKALDDEISQYEAELEALQTRMLAMQMKNNGKNPADTTGELDIYKTASIGEVAEKARSFFGAFDKEAVKEGEQSLMQLLLKGPLFAAALMTVPVASGGYMLTKKQDEDEKKFKVMKDMAATNMTNISPRLSLTLDDNGNPVVKAEKDAEIA